MEKSFAVHTIRSKDQHRTGNGNPNFPPVM